MENTGGIYIAERNGTCQHCGHRFFSSSPTPAPICFHCKSAGKAVKVEHTDPEPPQPAASGAITWGGQAVNAPGFTQGQFERAMVRAFVDQLEVKQDRHNGRYLVGHPDSYAYAVTREHCGCKAGEMGTPCKHRAMLLAHLDIRVPALVKAWAKLNAERPVAGSVVAS